MALSDVYSQQPWAPAQGVQQQQQQAFGQLPALAMQKQQMDAQKAEQDRQNRPITPWQKAVMRLMAGHDPKAVAADTKAELGQGGGQDTPPGGQGSPQLNVQGAGGGLLGGAGAAAFSGAARPGYREQVPTMDNNMVQMPSGGPPMQNMGQQSYSSYRPGDYNAGAQGFQNAVPPAAPPMPNRQPLPAARQFAMDRNAPQQSQGLSGVTMQQGAPSAPDDSIDTISQGMNNRDFHDYTESMKPILSHKEQRDRLEEIRLQNEGRMNVASANNASKEKVAQARVEFDSKKLNHKDLSDELNRRIKSGELDEKTAHHVAQIQLGYASLSKTMERFDKTYDQKDRLEMAKLLVKDVDAQEASFAKVESSLTGIVGMSQSDIKSDIKDKQEKMMQARKMAMDEINKQKNAAPSSKSSKTKVFKFKNGRTAPVPESGWEEAVKRGGVEQPGSGQ